MQGKRTNHQCKLWDIQFELQHKWSVYIVCIESYYSRMKLNAICGILINWTIHYSNIYVMRWDGMFHLCAVHFIQNKMWIHSEVALYILEFTIFVMLSENSFICGIFRTKLPVNLQFNIYMCTVNVDCGLLDCGIWTIIMLNSGFFFFFSKPQIRSGRIAVTF